MISRLIRWFASLPLTTLAADSLLGGRILDLPLIGGGTWGEGV
jgi:hypothetical protein